MEHLEDRALLATIGIGPAGLHVAEGGVATLQVTTSQPSMQPTPFTFRTVSGTAIGGTDYQHIPSGSGTIQPYATFANISIQAIEDYFTDIGETFSVELLTATGATINPSASSATVAIDDVAPGGGGGGGGSATLTMSVPADVDEGEGFLLTVQLSTPGTYQINASIDWGATPGAGPAGFSGTTNPDGSFTIGHQYFDDGPAPGNGTPQDLQSITLTGSATQYTMQGPVSFPLSGMTSTTIHNVAPEPVFDVYNYMPIGGPHWVVSGAYQDVGLADKGTITINWGDGSAPLVFADVSPGFSFSTYSQPHRYPPDGLSYTITVTITDDDTGSVSYSETAPLYLLDLDNDANNNGEISAADEPFEPPTEGPGRYIAVNDDDDNENEIPDRDETGAVSGENDLEPFLVRWRGDMRPDIQNYYGWHLTLSVPHSMPDEYFLNPRIWLNPDKSGGQLEIEALAPLSGGYGKEWTIGVETIPETLYLEARQTGGIGLQLHLWTPTGEGVEADFIAFTAVPPPKVDVDGDSNNDGAIAEDDDPIEMDDPGYFIPKNNDDDNANARMDSQELGRFRDAAGQLMDDDELKPVQFHFVGDEAAYKNYTVTFIYKALNSRLWKTKDKEPFPLSYKIGTDVLPVTFYIEGFEDGAGHVSVDLSFAGIHKHSDQIKVFTGSTNLVAYRPQTFGPGYSHPFPKSEVPSDYEEFPGAGIRFNGDVETQEDDLIEVEAFAGPTGVAGAKLFLRRSDGSIRVYRYADKTNVLLGVDAAQTEVDVTGIMTNGFARFWVEWVNPNVYATATLSLTLYDARDADEPLSVLEDKILFDPFSSIVMVYLGRGNTPLEPLDGSSLIAEHLYKGENDFHTGYDVYAYNENALHETTPAGAPNYDDATFKEVLTAVRNRNVNQIAILGYSQGGGATYELSTLIAGNAITSAALLSFTCYIDAIRHDDADLGVAEDRRPIDSDYHVNYWQNHDFLLHGAPTPPPGIVININVTDTTWGAALTHTTMDHHLNVVTRLINGFVGPIGAGESAHLGIINTVVP